MKDEKKTEAESTAELDDLQQCLAAFLSPGTGGPRSQCDRPLAKSAWDSFIANTPVGVLILDRQGVIRLINRTDFGCATDQVVGKTLADFYDFDHKEAVGDCIATVFDTGRPRVFEAPAVRVDGELHWYQAHVGPIFERGKVVAASVVMVNVSKRKGVEREEAAAKAILNAVLESLPFEFFALARDGRYMLQNAISRSQRGDLIGKRPADVDTDKENVALWLENNRRAFAGERVTGEVQLTLHGEKRDFYNIITPISQAGEIVGVLGVNVDITDRKRAERTLNESEQRYRLLMEAIPQVVWKTDPNGEAIDFNRQWCEYTGQTPETARGRGWMEAMHPEDRAQFETFIQEVLIEEKVARGELYETQYRLRRASDGQFRWQLARGFQMKDDQGQILGWIGTTTDIHEQKMAQQELARHVAERTAELEQANRELQGEIEERKRAEEALRWSEEKYRTLVETSPDAVLMANLSGQLMFASARAVELLGYASAEEFRALNATDLVAERERPRMVANLPRLEEKGLRRGIEYQGLRKDGTEFPCEVSSALVREPDGTPSGLVAIARDITERKEAEKALQRERRTLEQLLESGDHERRMISYEIHDGLTQELTAALMQFDVYEHLLNKGDCDNAKTAYTQGVEMVRRAHAEARRLINGVRPPVLGGPEIELCIAEDFQRLPPTLENAVYRMAQEALKNACKHSQSTKVRLTLVPEDGRIVLEVRDWGIGFHPGAVPGGRFGLQGIRERARILGGRVTIDSQPGEGTCIRVVVPMPGKAAG